MKTSTAPKNAPAKAGLSKQTKSVSKSRTHAKTPEAEPTFEEKEMFPKAEKSKLDLVALGTEMEEHKSRL